MTDYMGGNISFVVRGYCEIRKKKRREGGKWLVSEIYIFFWLLVQISLWISTFKKKN